MNKLYIIYDYELLPQIMNTVYGQKTTHSKNKEKLKKLHFTTCDVTCDVKDGYILYMLYINQCASL